MCTECNVRDRNAKHEGNCRHRHQPGTRLSSHIWHLKDQGHSYTTSWKILTRASSFNPSSGMCRLCMKEKFHIMFSPATATLNLRGEVFSSCRHRQLQNYLTRPECTRVWLKALLLHLEL